ncbi:glycosyltransferase family 2 protein [Actinomyces howellii]|uniref:Glycosyl transferase family 2 n=1 Tax=Actinomyces howellii TaxID=52771 RepID=A0A3S5EH85_9ACTO|nr:glycosyltransferase [Actinomyces howellii]VEG30134.1 Glycosyl transferase family 2 [Actinomyces howellii]
MRVSVVIGFRDWGAGRLELAARSVLESLAGLDGQLIVSDYGSRDPEPARAVAAGLGVAHVYTPVQGPWSRSRALNAGFALSDGDLLVSTDADMLFAPGTFPRVVRTARRHAGAALFMQCRDLPVGMDDQWLRLHRPDWADLERAARLRPRWGMGGMMAIPRAGFEALRGFDERFHTYGERISTSRCAPDGPATGPCGSTTPRRGCTTCGTPRPRPRRTAPPGAGRRSRPTAGSSRRTPPG